MVVAKKPAPKAHSSDAERYRRNLFERERIGERRSSKPEGFRFLTYEFLQRGVKLNYGQMAYFGDEWDRRPGPALGTAHGQNSDDISGNDRLLFEAPDLRGERGVHLFNVGDGLPLEFLVDRENTTMVGGGPMETMRVLRLYRDPHLQASGAA